VDLTQLTSQQRQIRSMIRGFLLTATVQEMEQEKVISIESGDRFRVDVIQELIDSEKVENAAQQG
jgi:hypothetical protein